MKPITIAQLIIEKSEGDTTNAVMLANNMADAYNETSQSWLFRDGSELDAKRLIEDSSVVQARQHYKASKSQ